MRIHLIIVRPQMRYVAAFIILSACSASNPFYSVEQSDVERGYRWIGRGDYTQAIAAFQHAIFNYPNSSLAHLGLADAFAEAGRELNAVEMYTKALPLLKADGYAVPEKTPGGEQTIGARFFSYQNQGLRFPYGGRGLLVLPPRPRLRSTPAEESRPSERVSGCRQCRLHVCPQLGTCLARPQVAFGVPCILSAQGLQEVNLLCVS